MGSHPVSASLAEPGLILTAFALVLFLSFPCASGDTGVKTHHDDGTKTFSLFPLPRFPVLGDTLIFFFPLSFFNFFYSTLRHTCTLPLLHLFPTPSYTMYSYSSSGLLVGPHLVSRRCQFNWLGLSPEAHRCFQAAGRSAAGWCRGAVDESFQPTRPGPFLA